MCSSDFPQGELEQSLNFQWPFQSLIKVQRLINEMPKILKFQLLKDEPPKKCKLDVALPSDGHSQTKAVWMVY